MKPYTYKQPDAYKEVEVAIRLELDMVLSCLLDLTASLK